MTEFLIPLLAALVALVAVGCYCYRWGRDDGYDEGYDEGRTKGLLEGAVVGGGVSPTAAGGPGAVPR